MIVMPFKNENTYIKMDKLKQLDKYHELFESALKEIELGKEYPNIVNGRDVVEEKKFNDLSPVDGKTVVGVFQMGSASSVDLAIVESKRSYMDWYNQGYRARAKIFRNATKMLSKKKFFYAALLSWENGKNRNEAMGDVDEAIDFMNYYADNLAKNKGFINRTGKAYENEDSESVMKPYGVFAVIPPFNFFSIMVGMTSGALITGNAVIVKPSSDTPLSSYYYVRLMHQAGVPASVIHFIAGSGSVVGKAMIEEPRIDGTVFTGSRDVGMYIYTTSAKMMMRPTITEMGGKDVIIVTEKADIDKAVEGVAKAAFGFDGQKCSACSKLLVSSKIKDMFLDKLVRYTESLKIGDPKEKDTFMGPVINKEAYEKFKKYAEIAKKDGKVLTGGDTLPMDGYYVKPTIVDNLPPNHEIMVTELFLPILAVMPFDTLENAIKEVNRLDYGLTGGIFTEDPDEIKYYFDHIEIGVAYANRRRGGSTGAMVGSQPFVGWKMSGSTGKGTGSYYYLQQFLREQSQTIAK